MLSKLHFQYIAIFSFLVIVLNWLLFADLSVDFIFLAANFIVVISSLILLNYCQLNYAPLKEKTFIKKIFWFSLILRVSAVLLYFLLFYYITATEFDVEANDAIWYDEIAQKITQSLLDGSFSVAGFLINIRGNFDDGGYIMFLSLIYSFFDNSVIIARLIQAIFSAFTVVLIYKVGNYIFGERTGKLAAILTATFQPLLLYASIHLKETFMIYFLFLFIYQGIKLVKTKITVQSVLVLILSLLALFSFRTVLGLTALLSLISYILLSGKYSLTKKVTILLSISTIIYFFVINLSVLDSVVNKSKKYAGIETGDETAIGGVGVGSFASAGQSFGKYAGGGVFLVQSIVMPYPSMVKTNIAFYNQTLQWYFAGGLLIWVFLSYYGYIGLYYAIKDQFKHSSILIFNVGIYTAALIGSFYMTSIRFNVVKMVLLIPFIAFGIVSSNKKMKRNFIKYTIIMSVIVLIWNYIKVAGRGLI